MSVVMATGGCFGRCVAIIGKNRADAYSKHGKSNAHSRDKKEKPVRQK